MREEDDASAADAPTFSDPGLSHRAFQPAKAASILGMGAQAVVAVDCDANYRLSLRVLQQAIVDCHQSGQIPITVVATLGTAWPAWLPPSTAWRGSFSTRIRDSIGTPA